MNNLYKWWIGGGIVGGIIFMIMKNKSILPTTGILSFNYFRRKGHYHKGIDLPAEEGTPIYSISNGIVTHASNEYENGFSGYGVHVVVKDESNNKWFLYGHLKNTNLKPGNIVRLGTKIGEVGKTGFTKENPTKLIKGPHLHLEVAKAKYPMASQSESKINPVDYLTNYDLHPYIKRNKYGAKALLV